MPKDNGWRSAAVVRVHDGDTVIMNIRADFAVVLPEQAIRVSGVDTPELDDPRPEIRALAQQARQFTVDWCAAHAACANDKKGRPAAYPFLLYRLGTDKYGGRADGTIHCAKEHDLVADLLAAGRGKPYTGVGPRPVWP